MLGLIHDNALEEGEGRGKIQETLAPSENFQSVPLFNFPSSFLPHTCIVKRGQERFFSASVALNRLKCKKIFTNNKPLPLCSHFHQKTQMFDHRRNFLPVLPTSAEINRASSSSSRSSSSAPKLGPYLSTSLPLPPASHLRYKELAGRPPSLLCSWLLWLLPRYNVCPSVPPARGERGGRGGGALI